MWLELHDSIDLTPEQRKQKEELKKLEEKSNHPLIKQNPLLPKNETTVSSADHEQKCETDINQASKTPKLWLCIASHITNDDKGIYRLNNLKRLLEQALCSPGSPDGIYVGISWDKQVKNCTRMMDNVKSNDKENKIVFLSRGIQKTPQFVHYHLICHRLIFQDCRNPTDMIMFSDDDDSWDTERFSEYRKHLRGDKEVILVPGRNQSGEYVDLCIRLKRMRWFFEHTSINQWEQRKCDLLFFGFMLNHRCANELTTSFSSPQPLYTHLHYYPRNPIEDKLIALGIDLFEKEIVGPIVDFQKNPTVKTKYELACEGFVGTFYKTKDERRLNKENDIEFQTELMKLIEEYKRDKKKYVDDPLISAWNVFGTVRFNETRTETTPSISNKSTESKTAKKNKKKREKEKLKRQSATTSILTTNQ